jgi:hypothetical protein
MINTRRLQTACSRCRIFSLFEEVEDGFVCLVGTEVLSAEVDEGGGGGGDPRAVILASSDFKVFELVAIYWNYYCSLGRLCPLACFYILLIKKIVF